MESKKITVKPNGDVILGGHIIGIINDDVFSTYRTIDKHKYLALESFNINSGLLSVPEIKKFRFIDSAVNIMREVSKKSMTDLMSMFNCFISFNGETQVAIPILMMDIFQGNTIKYIGKTAYEANSILSGNWNSRRKSKLNQEELRFEYGELNE